MLRYLTLASLLLLLFLASCTSSSKKQIPTENPQPVVNNDKFVPPANVTPTVITVTPTAPVNQSLSQITLTAPANLLPQNGDMKVYQSVKTENAPNAGVVTVTNLKSGLDIVVSEKPQSDITLTLPPLTKTREGETTYSYEVVYKSSDSWDFASKPLPEGSSGNKIVLSADKFKKGNDGKYFLQGTIVVAAIKIPLPPKDEEYALIKIGSDDNRAQFPEVDLVVSHGFVTDYKSVVPLAEAIKAAHIYRRVYCYSYPYTDSLYRASWRLRDLVSKQITNSGQKVDLVCHSMGCIVNRAAFLSLSRNHLVRNMFLVAGPNKGAKLADIYGLLRWYSLNSKNLAGIISEKSPSVLNMMTESDFIYYINDNPNIKNHHCNIVCFGEYSDEIVGYRDGLATEVNLGQFTAGSVNRVTFTHFKGPVGNHSYSVDHEDGRADVVDAIKNEVNKSYLLDADYQVEQITSIETADRNKWRIVIDLYNSSGTYVNIDDIPVQQYQGDGWLLHTNWMEMNVETMPTSLWKLNKKMAPKTHYKFSVEYGAARFIPDDVRSHTATLVFYIRHTPATTGYQRLERIVVPLSDEYYDPIIPEGL